MAVKQSAGQGKLAIEGSLIEIYVPQLKDIFTFSLGRPGIGISLCSLIIKGMITLIIFKLLITMFIFIPRWCLMVFLAFFDAQDQVSSYGI